MRHTFCWRRLDRDGLEVTWVTHGHSGIGVRTSLLSAGEFPLELRLDWQLDRAWRTRSLVIDRRDMTSQRRMTIERLPEAWIVDGAARSDLAACDEIDVSATPFCNSLALRMLGETGGELTALYVNALDLSVRASRQRYVPVAPGVWRYVDLGVAAGFEAELAVDDALMVRSYDGLFARV
ncbi:MAG: putative glycolipid-binding domain-containing protein [Acidobacteria bacterium]|jgi:hypothetical protein|nr:putative glycolipid-binding domain-containing protein [Acidobacteriota bacterium]